MHFKNLCVISVYTRHVADERNIMLDVENKILFGKYEVLSSLGTGNFSTVYLSRHIYLECYRAIKLIPKKQGTIDSLTEALLLKSLHHPGIPTIYDIEQDTQYYYIIEEYVDGESLEEFLLHQSHISLHTFFDLCLQLCDIFRYLHTFRPTPILYLDLKPEHIIVCGMKVKLIDFNVSTFVSNLGNIYHLYGNEKFSAPELFSGKQPDFLSDIYSIGKIMEYLSNYLDTSVSPKIHKIIKKAINSKPSHRYETVDALISAIETQKNILYQPRSRKHIAVIGSHAGCGSTHLAISLTSTLNYMGYNTIYYQCNKEDSLQQVSSTISVIKEKEGMLTYRYFRGYPHYGPGVQLPEISADFFIYDYGSFLPSKDVEIDTILYICSNSIWHWYTSFQKGESLLQFGENLKIICNLSQKKTMHIFSTYFSKPVFHYPYDADAFVVNPAKVTFVSKLFQIKRRNNLFFRLKNAIFPKR